MYFYKARLETKVNEKGVNIRFYPLHLKKKTIPFKEIESLESGKYHPVKEFGGWGNPLETRQNSLQHLRKQSRQNKQRKRKRRVIGTQKPEKLESTIREVKERKLETYPCKPPVII